MAVRLIIAAIFFGSVDVTNSVTQAHSAVDHVPIYLPYLPVVANLLFAVGLVRDLITLPLSLPVKFLPCISDALLAAWFVVDPRLPETLRTKCAWFYATCPLAIILVAFHGQWDALWLLPMVVALALAASVDDSGRLARFAVLGILCAVAVAFKPIPLALLPLALPQIRRSHFRTWLHDASVLIATFGAILATSLAYFAYEGFDIQAVLRGVRDYGATGKTVVVMGFARLGEGRGGLPVGLGLSVGTYRLLAIVVAAALLVRYHIRQEPEDRMLTAAAICLVLQAIGGIAPQYLLWPLPFILAAGRLRIASLYAAGTSLFLLLYYVIPGASFVRGENGGIFIPLRQLSWLAPPAGFTQAFNSDEALTLWRVAAHFLLPVLLLGLAVVLMSTQTPLSRSQEKTLTEVRVRPRFALAWAMPPAIVATVCAALYVALPVHGAGARLVAALPNDLSRYASIPPGFGPQGQGPVAPAGVGVWWLCAPVLLAVATLCWARLTAPDR